MRWIGNFDIKKKKLLDTLFLFKKTAANDLN